MSQRVNVFTTPDFRTRLQDWLPKLVLAPSLAVTLLFVYGFMIFTVVLSFTGSKMLPRFSFVGLENYRKLWALGSEPNQPIDLFFHV